jgi:hypothetical protein
MLRLIAFAIVLASLSLAGCSTSRLHPSASPGIAAPVPSNEIRPKKPLPIQWTRGERVPSSMQECRDVELRLDTIRVQSSGTIFVGTLVNRANEPRRLRPLVMLGTVWRIVVRVDGSTKTYEFARAPDAPTSVQYTDETTPWILDPGEEAPLHFQHFCILVDPATKSPPPAGVYRAHWEILYSVNDIEYEDFVKVCASDDNVVTVYVDPETAPAANAPE